MCVCVDEHGGIYIRISASNGFWFYKKEATMLVGPCHHGMARPQVAERGTASDKEGSCE